MIFMSKKRFNTCVDNAVKERIKNANNIQLETAVYYIDLRNENIKLKQTIERQNKILNAIKTVKEFLR